MVLCIMHGVCIMVYGNKTVTINDLYDSSLRQPAFSTFYSFYARFFPNIFSSSGITFLNDGQLQISSM